MQRKSQNMNEGRKQEDSTMPKVGNKHFPYTKKGKAAAKKAKARKK